MQAKSYAARPMACRQPAAVKTQTCWNGVPKRQTAGGCIHDANAIKHDMRA